MQNLTRRVLSLGAIVAFILLTPTGMVIGAALGGAIVFSFVFMKAALRDYRRAKRRRLVRQQWAAVNENFIRTGRAFRDFGEACRQTAAMMRSRTAAVTAEGDSIKAYCLPEISALENVDANAIRWFIFFDEKVNEMHWKDFLLEGDEWKGSPTLDRRIVLRDRLEATPWGSVRYGFDAEKRIGLLALHSDQAPGGAPEVESVS